MPHEYFVPLRAGFPYSLSLLNAIRSHRIQAKLRGEPPYAAFYRSDHPSRSLAITVEIMRAFVNEAKARAEKPLVLVIPTLLDLHHFEESGSWVYAPLVAELARHEIPFFDVGPTVFAAFQEQGIDTFFAPRSHLNAAGNRRFAGIVFKMLMARGLLPRGKGTGVQELAQGRPSAHDRAQKPEDDDRRQ
ncbi:MAG: SGNH/GDSL hydrolase family protein [Gammaproteobacteria bacterium]|nr:SGNH/GDSL hydrolase family protein [Gammaproteobacteria bacterium]